MVRSAIWMTVLVLLWGAATVAGAGQADGDEEIEWSYARPGVLRQAGPRLGRHTFRAVMRTAFPHLRAPDENVEQGDPVIGQLLTLRGRFVQIGEQGVEPGPHSVALLAVWEEAMDQSVAWTPELVVVGLVAGRLVVLGRYEMEDLSHDFIPGQDAGSAYRLEAWPIHPGAAGIGVRLDRSLAGPGGREANAQQTILFIRKPEQGAEEGQEGELVDVFMRQVFESTLEHSAGEPAYGEVARTRIGIDRQRLVNGLRVVETEFHTTTTEAGRVRRVEIEYEWYCWADEQFDTCDEEQLDPTAPHQQAR